MDTEVLDVTLEATPEVEVEFANPTYRGPQGPQGPQGPAGPRGPAGPQGPTGSYSAGSGISITDETINLNVEYLSNSDILDIWNNIT